MPDNSGLESERGSAFDTGLQQGNMQITIAVAPIVRLPRRDVQAGFL